MDKIALITGCNGQDGSYLAELLLDKGYKVFGLVRRKSTDNNTSNLKIPLLDSNFHLVYGDITDAGCMIRLIDEIVPDEIYHLAAQSFVAESWRTPNSTMKINAGGTLNILEAVRIHISNPHHYVKPKVYIACSSEQFGKVRETPQTELTPFYPRSPYGVSKVASYWFGVNYRESYGMFVSCGILFNHESERRGLEFVTRKITDYVAQLKTKNTTAKLQLGNLDAKRDWGYSKDYVEAMWLMLQHSKAEDFVVSTGEQYSVKDFCKEAFDYIGFNWESWVETNEKFTRPAEVNTLLGDSTKANLNLCWEPRTSFKEMVHKMVDNDTQIWKGRQNA